MTLEMDIYKTGELSMPFRPQVKERIRSGEDITSSSIGERTRLLLSADSEAQDSMSSFRIENTANGNRVAILLPGIVPSSDITFFRQKQALIRERYELISVDYSAASFRMELLRGQLADFVNSDKAVGKEIALIGVSLGTAAAIDLVINSTDEETRSIKKLVLMGAIRSADDIADPVYRKLYKISHRFAPELLRRSLMPFVRRGFHTDEQYTQEFGEDTVRQDIGEVSIASLADRMNAIASVEPPNEAPSQRKKVKALFISWEKDYSSQETLRGEMDLFEESRFVTVEGRHGQAASSSSSINAAIIEFLNDSATIREAA